MRYGQRLCSEYPCLIEPERFAGCSICALPLKKTPSEEGIICPECRYRRPPFSSIHSLSPFSPRTRVIIHQMKYLKNSSVAKCLGWQLAIFLTTVAPFLILENSVIVPVPITLGKLFRRGFNQSALMAKYLSRITGIPYLAWGLRRVAEFSPQAGRTAMERQLLTQGVFRINTLNRKIYKNIILLDDVATTLATLNAAAGEIRNVLGTKVNIYGLTAARSL